MSWQIIAEDVRCKEFSGCKGRPMGVEYARSGDRKSYEILKELANLSSRYKGEVKKMLE